MICIMLTYELLYIRDTPTCTNATTPTRDATAANYYIIQGVIPDVKPADCGAKHTWDHVSELTQRGENVFVWTSGVWSGYVYPKEIVTRDLKFRRAPMSTIYIKKSDETAFLDDVEDSYKFMGYTPRHT